MSGYREGMTNSDIALFRAASRTSQEGVASALANGANPNAIDDDGQSPLHSLAEARAAISIGPFCPLQIAHALIKAGALPDALDEAGRSPLQVAAARVNTPVVEALAQLGCSLKGSLAEAAVSIHGAQTIELLLSLGADPLETNPRGQTALEVAKKAWGGPSLECLALLEAAEMRLSATASSNRPPPRL